MSFALSAILIPFLLVGWRQLLPRMVSGLKHLVYSTGKVLILGNGAVAAALIKEIELDKTADIAGIVWPVTDTMPGEFEGYPVLGNLEDSRSILQRQRANLLLIATTESWYSAIIEALALLHLKHLTIKWVPDEILAKSEDHIPSSIPLNDFSV